jgi:hypothetical protein
MRVTLRGTPYRCRVIFCEAIMSRTLLRAYAAEQANAHDSRRDRNAAVGRVLDH